MVGLQKEKIGDIMILSVWLSEYGTRFTVYGRNSINSFSIISNIRRGASKTINLKKKAVFPFKEIRL